MFSQHMTNFARSYKFGIKTCFDAYPLVGIVRSLVYSFLVDLGSHFDLLF